MHLRKRCRARRGITRPSARGRKIPVSADGGGAVQEGVDLALDVRVQILGNGQPVHPLSHANVENACVQTPDQFHFRFLCCARLWRGNAISSSEFPHHRAKYALAQLVEIASVDAFPRQPGKDEGANPLALQDDARVSLIEGAQTFLKWDRTVSDQTLPLSVPSVDLVVDAIDQRFLGPTPDTCLGSIDRAAVVLRQSVWPVRLCCRRNRGWRSVRWPFRRSVARELQAPSGARWLSLLSLSPRRHFLLVLSN